MPYPPQQAEQAQRQERQVHSEQVQNQKAAEEAQRQAQTGRLGNLAESMALSQQHHYHVPQQKANPFYKTTTMDYNPKWHLTQDNTIRDYTVPTFDELLDKRQKFFKMEATLKNEFTGRGNKAAKDEFESKLTEYDRMKLKFDRNAVVAKDFPFKPDQFKQIKPAINVGNELYMTTNMDYGRLAPSAYEINTRWFPNNNTFTRELPGGPYQNNSLKTAVHRNKVHDYLDGFN